MRCVALLALMLAACGPGAEVKSGRELYLSYGCAACHGPHGKGDGPAAALSPVKPRDFTDAASYRGARSVEGIASIIAFGVADGRTGMPAYPDVPKRERVAMAEYLLSLARERAEASVNVTDAWMRPPNPAVRIGAAYLKIENPTRAPIALVAVTSPNARVVELHEMTMRDGMMSMRRTDRIDIPARGSVTLAPEGSHLMLIDTQSSLPPEVLLRLKFDDGSERSVFAAVREDA